MPQVYGFALVGAIVFSFLAFLHAFVWYHQRYRWSLQLALGYLMISAVYALDNYTQPIGDRPSVLGAFLGMFAMVLLTLAMLNYSGAQGRAVHALRQGVMATGAVFIVCTTLGWASRVALFSAYAGLLFLQALTALWAARREPGCGHHFVLIALLLYPMLVVAMALHLIGMDTLRYAGIVPGVMVGGLLLTVGLVRAQRRAVQALQQRTEAERAAHQLAYFDHLTGLPNRRQVMDHLQKCLQSSARTQQYGAVVIVDLDHFKNLNDTQGHSAGDRLLCQAAQRLKHYTRGADTLARLGGDEFMLILEDLGQEATAAAAAAQTTGGRVLRSMGEAFALDEGSFHISSSLGLTLFHGEAQDVDALLKQADLAMYQAKAAGRNTLRFFDTSMQAAIDERMAMESALRNALHKQEFTLHYQPQVEVGRGVTGAEALIRWNSPTHGLVSPAKFIPLAEASGQIVFLGEWVLRTACTQLHTWGRDPATATLNLSVNVSIQQFRDPCFVDRVLSIVREAGAPPARLKLELTESLLAENVDDIIRKMEALKHHGIGFSLDDFGTGYSSLSYLKRMPLSQLKIDQSFVRNVLSDRNEAAIARTIITLGHALELNVIAEGVETPTQRDFLIANGCTSQQGYLFGKPMPIAEFNTAHAAASSSGSPHDPG